MSDFTRSTRHNPCPICHKPDWCRTFSDGWTQCMRAESHRPVRSPNSGGWLHWTGAGDPPHGHDWRDRIFAPNPQPTPATPPSPPVDHELRARGLRALLEACPLATDHWAQLASRGLSGDQIERHGYGSLPTDQDRRRAIAAAVVEACGSAAFGQVPGLCRDNAGRPTIKGAPGILIPSRAANGTLQGLRIRADDTTGGKYRWLSSGDDDAGCGSGAPAHVAIPAGGVEGARRALLTEGELKANIIADRLGLPCVGVPGVTNITAGLAALAVLGIEDICIAYDQDAATNRHVAHAEAALISDLTVAGYRVLRGTWPAAYKGLDDALAAGVLPMIEPVAPDMSLCTERVAELEAQLATVTRERNQYRCERDEARHTLSTVVQTSTNRNLGDSGGAALILVSADVNRQAAIAPTSDGFYNVNPKRVADRWVDDTDEGKGRPGVLSEGTLRRYLKRFKEAGILDVEYRKDTFTVPETGKVIPIEVPWVRYAGSLAAQLAPGAVYHDANRPDRGGKRPRHKVAVLPTICPDCGSAVHAACRSCGSMVAPVTVEVSDVERDVLEGVYVVTEPAQPSHDQLENSNTVPTEGVGIRVAETSHDQLDHTTPLLGDRLEVARADLVRRRATADVHPLIAAADEATDPSEFQRVNADLFATLESVARARGRSPVPKPQASPGYDPWDTLPPPGARP